MSTNSLSNKQKCAFVYDGQGAQTVGMGKDLYDAYSVFQNTMDEVDPTGKYRELCFNGTSEQLADTKNTQPCMVAVEVALTNLLQSVGIEPAMAFGLSLGEYAALYAAGVFEAKQAVDLAAFRGEQMADAAKGYDCSMVAVLGADESTIAKACENVSPELGLVAITNFNCPGQIVISGQKPAVEEASRILLAEGVKRCIELKVSGPFHTKLMKPAGDALEAKFKTEQFGKSRVPVLFNTTAKPLEECGGRSVAELLVEQVQSPIHFDKCVMRMVQDGIECVVELGMGNSLSKFVKKVDKNVQCYQVHDAESFEKTSSQLKG